MNKCPYCGAPEAVNAPGCFYCGSDNNRKRSKDCLRVEIGLLKDRVKRLESILGRAEFAISFANLESGVTRMLGDDYTEVLQLIRSELKEPNP